MSLHPACHTDTADATATASRSIFHCDASTDQRAHAHTLGHAPVPLLPSAGYEHTAAAACVTPARHPSLHSDAHTAAVASPTSAATPALHSPSSRSSAASLSLSLSHCSHSRSSVSVSTYGGGGMGGAYGWRSRAASMADCCDDPPLPDEGGRALSFSSPSVAAAAAAATSAAAAITAVPAHDQHSAKKPRLKQHHSSPAVAMDSGSLQSLTAADMPVVTKCAARAALQLSISLSATPPPLPHSSSSSANSTANHSPALGPAPSPPSFAAAQHYVYVPSAPASASSTSAVAATAAAASFTSQTPDGRSSTANSFSRHSWGQPPQTPALPFSAQQQPHSSAHYRFPMQSQQQQQQHSHHHHSASFQLPSSSGPGGALSLARAHSSLVEAVASAASHHGRAHLHSPPPPHACSSSGAAACVAMAGLNDPPPRLPVPGHSCPLLDDDGDADEEEEEELHADQYKPLLPTVKGTPSITPETMMELLRGCGHAAASASASTTPFSPAAGPSHSPAQGQSHPHSHSPSGLYSHLYDRVVVVDARFPYEYAGGHIKSALNLYTTKHVFDYFLSDEMIGSASAGGGNADGGSLRHKSMAEAQRTCIVFHCEYSQLRGPHLFQRLRARDRDVHLFRDPHDHASLHYPEMYILAGGYKAFYERFGAGVNSAAGTPLRGPTPVPVAGSATGAATSSAAAAAAGVAPVVCTPSPQLPSFQASIASSARSVSVPLPPSALGHGFGFGSGAAGAGVGVGTHHRPHAISAARAQAHAHSYQQHQQQQKHGGGAVSHSQFQSIASVTSSAGHAHTNARWGSGSGALSPSTADAATVARGVAAMALDGDSGSGSGCGGGAIGAGLTIDVGQANGTSGSTAEGVAAAMATAASASAPASSSSCTGGASTSTSTSTSALASPSFPGHAPEFEHLFDSPTPSYVRMRDARFKEQCAVLLRDHESEKKMTLARSASTGALVPGMQHAHAHSRAAGTRTPAQGPLAHPPTPPTPRLDACGARVLTSPIPGAGAAGGSPAPLAPRTLLTPRLGATSLHSIAAASSSSSSGADHVDMLHTELRTIRRRSASTYTAGSYAYARAATPLSALHCEGSAAAAAEPSTPGSLTRHLSSHALPPSGRESFGSTSGSVCGSGSGFGPGSSISGDTPLLSPVASSRSPVLSRSFSTMMEAASFSPGLGAASSNSSRLGQTPSPSRNIFSVGSGIGLGFGLGLGSGGGSGGPSASPALGSPSPSSSSRASVASACFGFGSGTFSSSSSLNASANGVASPSSASLPHSHSYSHSNAATGSGFGSGPGSAGSGSGGGGGGGGAHPFTHRSSSSACALPSPPYGGAGVTATGASPHSQLGSPAPAAPTPPALPPSPPQLVQSRSDFTLTDSKRPAGMPLNEKRVAAAAAAAAAAAEAAMADECDRDDSAGGFCHVGAAPMSSLELEGVVALERDHDHGPLRGRRRGLPMLPRSLCTSPTPVAMAVAEEEETDNE